jgi:hypothetical protein
MKSTRRTLVAVYRERLDSHVIPVKALVIGVLQANLVLEVLPLDDLANVLEVVTHVVLALVVEYLHLDQRVERIQVAVDTGDELLLDLGDPEALVVLELVTPVAHEGGQLDEHTVDITIDVRHRENPEAQHNNLQTT